MIKQSNIKLTDGEEYVDLEISQSNFENQSFGDLDFKNCLLKDCRFNRTLIKRLTLIDVVLDNCDLANLEVDELYIKNSRLEKCRLTGLMANESTQENISYNNCQMNLSQFRFARLKKIFFRDCLLDEADFYAAKLNNNTFTNCHLRKAQFNKTENIKTDFRSSSIEGINVGINDLPGIIISRDQVNDLAWLLGVEID